MKNKLLFVFTFTLISGVTFLPEIGNCAGEREKELFEKIEECTDGVSLKQFLDEFNVDKTNKIVIKEVLSKDIRKTKNIATLNEKEMALILSELNKLKCVQLTLTGCIHEFWLYKNDKLLVKVAFGVAKTHCIIRFYRAEHNQADNSPIAGDFVIDDEELCKWLYYLAYGHFLNENERKAGQSYLRKMGR